MRRLAEGEANAAFGGSDLGETARKMREGEVEVNLEEILAVLVEDHDSIDVWVDKVDDLQEVRPLLATDPVDTQVLFR